MIKYYILNYYTLKWKSEHGYIRFTKKIYLLSTVLIIKIVLHTFVPILNYEQKLLTNKENNS